MNVVGDAIPHTASSLAEQTGMLAQVIVAGFTRAPAWTELA